MQFHSTHTSIFILLASLSSTEKGISDRDAWGEDESDYYNDRPDARPPLAEAAAGNANYSAPKSNLPVSYTLIQVNI
jgi:hypothetical protein